MCSSVLTQASSCSSSSSTCCVYVRTRDDSVKSLMSSLLDSVYTHTSPSPDTTRIFPVQIYVHSICQVRVSNSVNIQYTKFTFFNTIIYGVTLKVLNFIVQTRSTKTTNTIHISLLDLVAIGLKSVHLVCEDEEPSASFLVKVCSCIIFNRCQSVVRTRAVIIHSSTYVQQIQRSTLISFSYILLTQQTYYSTIRQLLSCFLPCFTTQNSSRTAQNVLLLLASRNTKGLGRRILSFGEKPQEQKVVRQAPQRN